MGNQTQCDLLRENFAHLFPVGKWKPFNDDLDLMDINCYWLRFEPASFDFRLFVSFISVAISSRGLIGNVLVVSVHLR